MYQLVDLKDKHVSVRSKRQSKVKQYIKYLIANKVQVFNSYKASKNFSQFLGFLNIIFYKVSKLTI